MTACNRDQWNDLKMDNAVFLPSCSFSSSIVGIEIMMDTLLSAILRLYFSPLFRNCQFLSRNSKQEYVALW